MQDGYRERMLVIGAGVSGLTSALVLLRRGYDVPLVADRFDRATTSAVAGALWEFPPAVCGHEEDAAALARARKWSAVSYTRFVELAEQPGTGVSLRPAVFYFRRPLAELPRELEKMEGAREHVQGFRHDARLIREHGVDPSFGVCDAYTYLAPMVDTDRYLVWLRQQVAAGGARIVEAHLDGPLVERAAELCRAYEAAALVNCTGLAGRALGDENVYPLRGALVRARNEGTSGPRITTAHCLAHDDGRGEQNIVFIVPRGEDRLVLGGLAEPEEWDVGIDLENYPPVREMLERCRRFLPALRDVPLDEVEPVRVGLRPMRRGGARVESEPGGRVVHNYGHGGAGVTLSWGCAEEVVGKW